MSCISAYIVIVDFPYSMVTETCLLNVKYNTSVSVQNNLNRQTNVGNKLCCGSDG